MVKGYASAVLKHKRRKGIAYTDDDGMQWFQLSIGCTFKDDLDDVVKQLGNSQYKVLELEGLFYVFIPNHIHVANLRQAEEYAKTPHKTTLWN